MKWLLRLLTLASTTACGILFLGHMDTIWVGLGLLCSGILYRYLVRNMRPISK